MRYFGIFAAVFLMASFPGFAFAEITYSNSTSHYSIALPEGWIQIPQEEISDYFKQKKIKAFECVAFQLPSKDYFQIPYVMISEDAYTYEPTLEEMVKYQADSYPEGTFDKEKKILFLKRQYAQITCVTAMFYGKEGLVDLNLYVPNKEYGKWEPIVNAFMNSFAFESAFSYDPEVAGKHEKPVETKDRSIEGLLIICALVFIIAVSLNLERNLKKVIKISAGIFAVGVVAFGIIFMKPLFFTLLTKDLVQSFVSLFIIGIIYGILHLICKLIFKWKNEDFFPNLKNAYLAFGILMLLNYLTNSASDSLLMGSTLCIAWGIMSIWQGRLTPFTKSGKRRPIAITIGCLFVLSILLLDIDWFIETWRISGLTKFMQLSSCVLLFGLWNMKKWGAIGLIAIAIFGSLWISIKGQWYLAEGLGLILPAIAVWEFKAME
jgi:hypothetical protein